MDSVLKKLEEVLNDEDGFFMKVRNLEGCDDAKLNEVLLALKEIGLFYADKTFVPKYLYFLIIDMEPVLFGMIDSYNDEGNQQIFMAIDKISTALGKCFSTD